MALLRLYPSLIILVAVAELHPQQISMLRINDGQSYPLKDGDDGFMFQYRTESYGDASCYLRRGQDTYRIFSDIREIRGTGYIELPPEKAARFCDWGIDQTHACQLVLIHVDFQTKHYSDKLLPISMRVNAPYGCKLLPMPHQPSLLPTDLTTRELREGLLLGLITGSLLLIAGVISEQRYLKAKESDSNDSYDDEIQGTHTAMALGLVLAYLCAEYLYKITPDVENNNRNEIHNKRARADWEGQTERTKLRNQLIKNTYQISMKSYE